MKTMEEVMKMDGITKNKDWGHKDSINMHFSPIPNWYACILGFCCPVCDNGIDWEWDFKKNIPIITGAKYLGHAHRFIHLKCNVCSQEITAENFD